MANKTEISKICTKGIKLAEREFNKEKKQIRSKKGTYWLLFNKRESLNFCRRLQIKVEGISNENKSKILYLWYFLILSIIKSLIAWEMKKGKI